MRHLLLLLCTILPLNAAAWTLRSGDVPWDAPNMATFLDGRTVTFMDGGRSIYGPGATYAYVYLDGGRADGTYEIMEDGSTCVAYPAGFARCDIYVMNGERLYLIDEDGNRYPAREIE